MLLFCPPQAALPELSRVRPSRISVPPPLMAMPPCASVAPDPLIVPPDQLSSPVTVRFPPPASVPPPNVKGALIRDAAARVSVPPDRMNGLLHDRLLTATLPVRKVIAAPPGTSIPASSLAPGTTPVLQFEGSSQEP